MKFIAFINEYFAVCSSKYLIRFIMDCFFSAKLLLEYSKLQIIDCPNYGKSTMKACLQKINREKLLNRYFIYPCFSTNSRKEEFTVGLDNVKHSINLCALCQLCNIPLKHHGFIEFAIRIQVIVAIQYRLK